MTLRLSHSHGASLIKSEITKITAAGRRKARVSGSFSSQRNSEFEARQMQRPRTRAARGSQTPKLNGQNKRKGRANSETFSSNPGFKVITDLAEKWSVMSQTKKVAGRNALATSLAMYLRMGASPNANRKRSTMLSAIKVCRWKSGIEA